jgi:hypothetical protein
MQSNVREPGVNPGRLRHCNGYKFQCHREIGKAEGGSKPKSGYRFDLRSSWSKKFGQLLRKEKDGASPMNRFHRDSLDAFIPRFAGA